MKEIGSSLSSNDVKVVKVGEKKYILIGTAHISKKSAELVHEIIESEKPDTVCVELDHRRYEALSGERKWESMDLKEIIKKKQLTTLFINILLASYQKKIGGKLGVAPGIELAEAVTTARRLNIPVSLCDRDVRITLRRTWKSMSFWSKIKFLSTAIAGLFEEQDITEEKISELKEKDVVSGLIEELGSQLPVLKRVLIDERDLYIAQKMLNSEGNKIVSVVGAGHVKGIVAKLENGNITDLAPLEIIPNTGLLIKFLGWALPITILLSIFYLGIEKGVESAGNNILYWILITGIPSAIGAMFSFAHPLTILSSFLAAPLTSLSPLIGVGYVAALAQAFLKPPKVMEFHSVTDDIGKLKSWWQNKLLRVLLVFILTGIGGVIGTYLGTYEVIKNVLN